MEGSHRKKQIFCPLAHYLNDQHGQNRANLKPGATSRSTVKVAGAQEPAPSSTLPRRVGRELEGKWSS